MSSKLRLQDICEEISQKASAAMGKKSAINIPAPMAVQ